VKDTPLVGAVDLSGLKEGLGPREAAAFRDELMMMAQTRELALRDRVTISAENEGLTRALAALVYRYGTDDGAGKCYLTIDHDEFHDAMSRVAAFSLDPGSQHLHLVVTLRFDGEWTVSVDKPCEDDLDTLERFEAPPDVVTSPGGWRILVPTALGWRVATWAPGEA
jgi:hypothetical protein